LKDDGIFNIYMILVLQVDRLPKQLKEQQQEVSNSPAVFSCLCPSEA